MPKHKENLITLFPLPIAVAPFMPVPLHIFEKKYRTLVVDCQKKRKSMGLVMKSGSHIQKTGCLVFIEKIIATRSNGKLDILIRGTTRFTILDMQEKENYLQARIRTIQDFPSLHKKKLYEQAQRTCSILKEWSQLSGVPLNKKLIQIMDPQVLSFFTSSINLFSMQEKQRLLEIRSTYRRLSFVEQRIREYVLHERNLLQLAFHVGSLNKARHLLN